MKIWEFVLTGGPCAGKTQGLSILEQLLTNKGFKVILVAETATELILSGITPWELAVTEFQSIILDRTFNKEKTVREAARCIDRDVIIFYDRGLLDIKAYIPYELFLELLKKRGITETQVRDQYNAVFHLVSAAEGAEQYYTLSNNVARSETLEEARNLDLKTRNAWLGHSHLRVIDNSTPFKEKIDRLCAEVFNVLGLPTPTEIERKYLIKKPNLSFLSAMGGVKLNIVQTYLRSNKPLIERRVRQRGDGKTFSYYYTEKGQTLFSISRYKSERRISVEEYIAFLTEGISTIRKERYCFLFENQYFELDIYPDWDNQAILEIELREENQVPILPPWIDVIEDVTENPRYLNVNLAK